MVQKYLAARPQSNEHGAVLVLFAFIILALLGITALMVDIPRQEVLVQELQAASDAAALSAAGQLDGTKAGWDRAKEAARIALEENYVDGVRADELIENSDNEKWLELTAYYNLGEKAEEEGFKRIPLNSFIENDEEYLGLSPYALANAATVTLTFKNYKSTFGRVLNFKGINQIERTATAVANTDTEQCVLPFAIPACEMFKQLNPAGGDGPTRSNWETDEPDIAGAATRELIFMESIPYAPITYFFRGAGLERHLFYPALPTAQFPQGSTACGVGPGQQENCRAGLLRGVLGVHSDFQDQRSDYMGTAIPASAEPAELVEFLAGSEGCQKVKIGSFFRPLENAAEDGGGLLRNQEIAGEVSDRFAELINDPTNALFTDAFGDASQGDDAAQKNYPFLRYGDSSVGGAPRADERVYSWSPYRSDQRVLLADMSAPDNTGNAGKWTWTSPMCHDERIPADDRNTARVKQGVAMLIASEDFKYCDFYAGTTTGVGQYSAPDAVTRPRVVGFVKVNFYDFNFSDLEDRFGDTNTPRYPRADLAELVDLNPAGIIEDWVPPEAQ